ncbi:unnamed protein product [Caenorhabditis sp. 36 PRJEB53466]|nr:unnamed protein product [Caenorhabditis sp. 36 PRJEB53466]
MPPGSDLEKIVPGAQNLRSVTSEQSRPSGSGSKKKRHSSVRNSTPPEPLTASQKRKSDGPRPNNSTSERHTNGISRNGIDHAVNQELAARIERVRTNDSEPGPSTSEKPNERKSKKDKRDWHPEAEVYSKKLYRQVASGFDLDADSDTDVPGTSRQAIISDNWKPEYSAGNQELAHPNAIPRMEVVNDDFLLAEKPRFVIPDKRIVCNPNVPYLTTGKLFDRNPPIIQEPGIYEITAQDAIFIRELNKDRKLANGEPYLTDYLFIKVVQIIEKVVFRAIHIRLLDSLNVVYIRDDINEEAECDVCRIAECDPTDDMVFCDMCNTCVHTACAGIAKLPASEVPWKCRKCTIVRSACPACVLCPTLGGSMTHTVDKKKWTHHVCALYMPEILFGDEDLRVPVTNFEKIPLDRKKAKCGVCDTRTGVCVVCCHPDCDEMIHVGCANRAGLTVKIQEIEGDPEMNVERICYCVEHSNKDEFRIEPQWRDYKNPWLAKYQSEFHISSCYEEIAKITSVEEVIISDIFEYWKQKRVANNCAPLIPLLDQCVDLEANIFAAAKKAVEAKILSFKNGESNKGKNHFFSYGTLMVTEMRQHHLKRVRFAIEKDLEMLTMVEKREQYKWRQAQTDYQLASIATRYARYGKVGELIQHMNVTTEELDAPEDPNFVRRMDAEVRAVRVKNVRRPAALPNVTVKKMSASSRPEELKSPLRPRNHQGSHPRKIRAQSCYPTTSLATPISSHPLPSTSSTDLPAKRRQGPGRNRIYPIGPLFWRLI